MTFPLPGQVRRPPPGGVVVVLLVDLVRRLQPALPRARAARSRSCSARGRRRRDRSRRSAQQYHLDEPVPRRSTWTVAARRGPARLRPLDQDERAGRRRDRRSGSAHAPARRARLPAHRCSSACRSACCAALAAAHAARPRRSSRSASSASARRRSRPGSCSALRLRRRGSAGSRCSGRASGFVDRLWHLTLPAVALGAHRDRPDPQADAGGDDRRARAGLRRVRARPRDPAAARALAPTCCATRSCRSSPPRGLILAYMLAGAVLVEVDVRAARARLAARRVGHDKDIPMVQGLAMLIALVVVLVNLIVDLVYLADRPADRASRRRTHERGRARRAAEPVARRAGRGGAGRPCAVVLAFVVLGVVVSARSSARRSRRTTRTRRTCSDSLAGPSRAHLARHRRPRPRHLLAHDRRRAHRRRRPAAHRARRDADRQPLRPARRLPRRAGRLGDHARSSTSCYALPGLLVAIVVVGVLGGGYLLAVGAARRALLRRSTRGIVRGATLEQRSRPYVEAARTLGLSRPADHVRATSGRTCCRSRSRTRSSTFAFALVVARRALVPRPRRRAGHRRLGADARPTAARCSSTTRRPRSRRGSRSSSPRRP